MSAPRSIGELAGEIVVRIIIATTDPAERKERIMIARECGAISAADAETLLGFFELEAA